MLKFDQLNVTNSTIIEWEGKELRTTQFAYCDSDFSLGYERTVWKAHAVDAAENEYKIIWTPVDGWEEIEDEEDCCDWTAPENVIKL